MSIRNFLSVLVLCSLLPAVAACSTQRTVHIATHPGEFPDELAAGEPVQVDGFTRGDGVRIEWSGYVSAVGADSLWFGAEAPGPQRKPATFGEPHPEPDDSFTVHATEVASIEVVEATPLLRAIIAAPLVVASFFVAAYVDALSAGLGP